MREGEREVSVIAVLLLLRACNFEPKTAKVNKLLGKKTKERKRKKNAEKVAMSKGSERERETNAKMKRNDE